ncbi:hypothetical protein H2203_006564 [Taxawa tesnikishii (nom. ined.)]|nr:hypothetical protein H2203_006564 [Dothideales sp. JES 119]
MGQAGSNPYGTAGAAGLYGNPRRTSTNFTKHLISNSSLTSPDPARFQGYRQNAALHGLYPWKSAGTNPYVRPELDRWLSDRYDPWYHGSRPGSRGMSNYTFRGGHRDSLFNTSSAGIDPYDFHFAFNSDYILSNDMWDTRAPRGWRQPRNPY